MAVPLKICVEKPTDEDMIHLNHIKKMSKSHQHYIKLQAAFYTAKLWPNNSTITVGFLEKPDKIHRSTIIELEANRDSSGHSLKIDPLQYTIDKVDVITAIKKIVNERINPIVNLKYIFIDDVSNAQIRISFDPEQGAWALLGTDCLTKKNPTDATMNLGWFDVGTTIHEFFHTLGCIHEHQNPSGNVIPWDLNAVYSWAEQTQGWDHDTTYQNIVERYKADQINGSTFDPNSIMLYFFPGSLTTDHKGTHENLILSPTDVQYVNSVYPDSPVSPQEFYQKIYNKKIDVIPAFDRKSIKTEPINESSNILTWVASIFFILIMAFVIFRIVT